jgi:hypothetical protein
MMGGGQGGQGGGWGQSPWLQMLAQRFHHGRGGGQQQDGAQGPGPWGSNPGSHNGGQGMQPRTAAGTQVPWAQPGGMAGIQSGQSTQVDGDQGVQPGGPAPARLPPNWLQSLGQGAGGVQSSPALGSRMPGMGMPMQQAPMANGWQQSLSPGGTSPDGNMPTQQVRMGNGFNDGPDQENDGDPDDQQQRRGY